MKEMLRGALLGIAFMVCLCLVMLWAYYRYKMFMFFWNQ